MKIHDLIHGTVEITEPVLIELIKTKPLQRIRYVNHFGFQLVDPQLTATRYDHCVGVMLLLRRYQASIEEQVAGLLHDVPHTAFSHITDFVFKESESQTYHERFLKKLVFDSEIPKVLKKYKIDPEFVTDEHNFSLLEQDLPQLCADRIDYSLRCLFYPTGVKQINLNQVLSAITCFEGKFVMTDAQVAYTYAKYFMQTCLKLYNSPRTLAASEVMGELFRTSMEKGVIVETDLFLTDTELWHKVSKSKEPRVKELIAKLTPDFKFEISETDYDFITRGKARYIDPPILTNGTTKPLSQINKGYAQEIEKFKKTVKTGHKIKII